MRLERITGLLGTTVYLDGELIAENVSVSLPAVSFAEVDVQAGAGPITVPLQALPQNLEASVTFHGETAGFAKALNSAGKQLEIRWAVSQLQPDQSSDIVGYKAFLQGIPRTVPALSLSPGEAASENEVTWTITRYQLVKDGENVLSIDKLAGKVEIDGTDQAAELQNLL